MPSKTHKSSYYENQFPGRVAVARHAPATFEPKEVLKRTGLRLGDEARATKGDLSSIGDGLTSIGAGDFTSSAGNLIVILLGGLLGLIMLDLLISPRGSTITSAALKWTGGAFSRVVSPTDPLTSQGAPTATAATSAPATTAAPTAGSAPKDQPGVIGGATPSSEYGQPLYPTPAGKIVPIPGTSQSADSAYVPFIGWIAKTFGVLITSGARSAADNAAVGGVSNSDHLKGLAVDFGGSPAALQRLYNWAISYGFPYVESPQQAIAAGEGPHVHISFFRPATTP